MKNYYFFEKTNRQSAFFGIFAYINELNKGFFAIKSIEMYQKLQAIVLNVIKYSDKNSIAHIYSDECGRMALLLPQGNTKGARMRNAIFMPLSVIELEVDIVPGKDLYRFRDARMVSALANLYGDPVKGAIVMFVSEFLCHVIQESERNSALFRYIRQSVLLLNDKKEGIANFHICFVYHLGAFLGIQPDDESYEDGAWFDMTEGTFTHHVVNSSHSLKPEQARVLHLMARMTFANMHIFKFNRAERSEILDMMIGYYKIHYSSVGSMKSPDILKQLFD